MPIDIDNTDVSDITIDGQNVEQVTADGNVVFVNKIIDENFEGGFIPSNWNFNASNNGFVRITDNNVINGSFSIEAQRPNNDGNSDYSPGKESAFWYDEPISANEDITINVNSIITSGDDANVIGYVLIDTNLSQNIVDMSLVVRENEIRLRSIDSNDVTVNRSLSTNKLYSPTITISNGNIDFSVDGQLLQGSINTSRNYYIGFYSSECTVSFDDIVVK